jgi:hypothetical protein
VFRDHVCRAESGAEFRAVVERFFPAEGPAASAA